MRDNYIESAIEKLTVYQRSVKYKIKITPKQKISNNADKSKRIKSEEENYNDFVTPPSKAKRRNI